MVNPDGYLFTQTENRLWRKTRKPNGDTGCFGTDANRNFGYHWGTGGSSDNACSDTYMGEAAFSEVETSNMRDWLTAHNDTIKFYNNVHSYSQLVLLPWGFGYEEPDNVDDLYRVAQAGNDALYAVHQKTYEVNTLINCHCALRMLTLLTPPRWAASPACCTWPAAGLWTGRWASWGSPTATPWSCATPASSASCCPRTRSSPPARRCGLST